MLRILHLVTVLQSSSSSSSASGVNSLSDKSESVSSSWMQVLPSNIRFRLPSFSIMPTWFLSGALLFFTGTFMLSWFLLCPAFSKSLVLSIFVLYSFCFGLLCLPVLHPAMLSSLLAPAAANILQQHLSSTPLLLRVGLAITTWYFSLHIFFAAVIILLVLVSLAAIAFLFERRTEAAEMSVQPRINGTDESHHLQTSHGHIIQRRIEQKHVRSFSRLPEVNEEEESEFHTPRIIRNYQRSSLKKVPSAMF